MDYAMLITKVSKYSTFKFFIMITSNSYYSTNINAFFIFQFSTQFLKDIKCVRFLLNKVYQVNLEKSSTHTNTYLLPAVLSTCMGPMRSMCNNSRTLEVVICYNRLCDSFTCLPIWHGPHTPGFFLLSGGIPRTTPALTILVRFLKLR